MKHKSNSIGFSEVFGGEEADVRSIVAHNVHEKIGRVQERGTSMLMFGPLIEYLDMSEGGKDVKGLGCWVVMTLKGGNGTIPRIVCRYKPCGNDKPNSSMVYQQHWWYFINKENLFHCPQVKFWEDLMAQLTRWREKENKLAVCLDANENIYHKSLEKALKNVDGLNMQEVVGMFTGKQIGATYFRGQTPIDGVWATSDVVVTGACVMPAGFGIGDHCMFTIDMLTESIVGLKPQRTVH
jgi:hypothetical protein